MDGKSDLTAVEYRHSKGLVSILDQNRVSLLASTYQAGKVFTIGTLDEKLQIRFHHFEHAMGLARTEKDFAKNNPSDLRVAIPSSTPKV